MTQAHWNRVVDELRNGAERIIGTIVDLRAQDATPETIALAAGFVFDETKNKLDELTQDAGER